MKKQTTAKKVTTSDVIKKAKSKGFVPYLNASGKSIRMFKCPDCEGKKVICYAHEDGRKVAACSSYSCNFSKVVNPNETMAVENPDGSGSFVGPYPGTGGGYQPGGQCQATTKKGVRCKNVAAAGAKYCGLHLNLEQ